MYIAPKIIEQNDGDASLEGVEPRVKLRCDIAGAQNAQGRPVDRVALFISLKTIIHDITVCKTDEAKILVALIFSALISSEMFGWKNPKKTSADFR